MRNIPKVGVDSNTILSGYLFGGKPDEILHLGSKKKIQIITSSQILAECIEVLRKKFKADKRQILKFQKILNRASTSVEPRETILFVIRDPDDNKFVEAAVEGNCEYIVSGDKNLLDLKEYKDIKIVSSAEFINKHFKAAIE